MNIDVFLHAESLHVLILRFDNCFILVKRKLRLINDLLHYLIAIGCGVTRHSPDIKTAFFCFRCQRMKAPHVKATASGIINGFSIMLNSTSPDFQM